MVWTGLAVCAFAPTVRQVRAGPAEAFTGEIRPLLESRCHQCHGPTKHKAGLNLASFTNFTQITASAQTWQTVLEKVRAYEMPPKGAPPLEFSEQQKLTAWLKTLPDAESPDCDQLASDRTVSFYRGYVMSRRLNRDEYNNTLRDLLGMDLHLQSLLPADGGGGEGFDTSGNALFLSPLHIEKYLTAAERALDAVLGDSPPSGEAARARAALLLGRRLDQLSGRESASRIVRSFARRAFRRPVTDEELERHLSMFDRAWKRGDGFLPSLRLALKSVLISPNFLFLAEPEPAEGGVQPLGALPLASRLSYFLWSSMPDDELLALAENGDLLCETVYRSEVHRMLADPKAQSLGERFAVQWLGLGRLGTEVRPEAGQYPEFDEALARAMREEVSCFFNHLVAEARCLRVRPSPARPG